MNSPLVSTIIIFWNAEAFIDEAIQSVLAQSFHNWELLLVDDGSNDRSTEIALRYVSRFPRQIRHLHHPGHQNRGMSASRNLGIRQARGEFIAFLDADDVWLPSKLERQVHVLQAHPEVGLVCGPTEYWRSWAGAKRNDRADTIRNIGLPADRVLLPPRMIPLVPQDPAKTPATCSVLMRSSLLDTINGFEDRFRGLYEDQAFFAKVYLHSAIYVLPDCLDRYRQHPDSCCALAEKSGIYHSIHRNPAHFEFLEWLENYLVAYRLTSPALWEPVQHALWPYRHPFLNAWIELHRNPVAKSRALLSRLIRNCLISFAPPKQTAG
jgi:glycosyltransferase involved in cell wall biosynthesis